MCKCPEFSRCPATFYSFTMFLYYQGKEQPAAAFTEHLFGVSNEMAISGSGSTGWRSTVAFLLMDGKLIGTPPTSGAARLSAARVLTLARSKAFSVRRVRLRLLRSFGKTRLPTPCLASKPSLGFVAPIFYWQCPLLLTANTNSQKVKVKAAYGGCMRKP
jgi:hypothetical protein